MNIKYVKRTMEIRVLFFTSSLGKGGAEKQILNIYKITKNIFETKICVAKKNNSRFNSINFNKKRTIYSTFKLYKEIKKFQPNYLFTTLPTPNVINIFLKNIFFKNIISVVRIANHNIDSFYTKIIIKKANIICFNSIENLELYTKNFQKYSSKFVYLNNIIEKHDVIQNNKKPKKVKALTVSRIEKHKGINYLIDAFRGFNSDQIELDIYGEGKKMKKYSIDLPKHISFKGYSDKIPWEEYNLFILPSLKEGMSNALLEAQVNNLFSIVSDCRTGNKEIIELTKNGVIFKAGSVDLLKKSIGKYIEGEINVKKSREIILEYFSEKKAELILRKNIFTQS